MEIIIKVGLFANTLENITRGKLPVKNRPE